jgi:cell division protein FtsA
MGYCIYQVIIIIFNAIASAWRDSSVSYWRNYFMAAKQIFAIDIGTATIKGAVVGVNPKKGAVEILAHREVFSRGVKRGVIHDVDDAARALGELVDQIEAVVERNMESAVVAIGGPHLATRFAKGTIVVSRADEEIGKEDVERAEKAMETTLLPQNREIIHVIPRTYLVDEVDRVKDPVGMQGTRLTAEGLIIDDFTPALRNVRKCLSVVGVEPALFVASPLAVARAVLSKRDMELGACALDIGAETTSLAVFEDGDLLHLAVIPLGSANISGDIAAALKIHFDFAEQIKIAAGHAVASQVSKKEMIALSEFIEAEKEAVSKKYLAEIIEARLSEILSLVADELKKIGRGTKFPAGVVLAGGGTRLGGIEVLTRHELKLPAKIASLDHYRKIFPEALGAQFYSISGLILWQLDEAGPLREKKGPLAALKKVFDIFLP